MKLTITYKDKQLNVVANQIWFGDRYIELDIEELAEHAEYRVYDLDGHVQDDFLTFGAALSYLALGDV